VAHTYVSLVEMSCDRRNNSRGAAFLRKALREHIGPRAPGFRSGFHRWCSYSEIEEPPICSGAACRCTWSALVRDIRGRALRLMLIRICLVMKTSLQPNTLTTFFVELWCQSGAKNQ
jgi:hypothetical protein